MQTGIGLNLEWYLENINPDVEETFKDSLKEVDALEGYILNKLNYFFSTDWMYSRLANWHDSLAIFYIYDSKGEFVGYYKLTRYQFNEFLRGYNLKPSIGSKYFESRINLAA